MPPRTARPPRPVLIVASLIIAILTLTLIVATGCEDVFPQSHAPTATAAPEVELATSQLADLVVAKPGSMKGYSREKFPHWRSTGENCDVRDSVLERDGRNVKRSGCNVVAGTWTSVYDGMVLNSPAKVDIDHVVPLADAWRSGASAWTNDKRSDFANDLDDPQLVAVSATSNRSKGDQDPSTWKPKETGNWCVYAQDWVAVKTHWKLTITAAEKYGLNEMLETCG